MSNIITNWNDIPEYQIREVDWPNLLHQYELSEELLDEFLDMSEAAENAIKKHELPQKSLLVSKFLIHTKDNRNQLEDLNLAKSRKIIGERQYFSEKLLMKHYDSLSFTDLCHNPKINKTWKDLETIYELSGIAHSIIAEEQNAANKAVNTFRTDIITEDLLFDTFRSLSATITSNNDDLEFLFSEAKFSGEAIEIICNSIEDSTFKAELMKNTISKQQSLTLDFMERHINELSIDNICSHQHISEEFANNHFEQLRTSSKLHHIFTNNSFSENFLDKHSEAFNKDCWNNISAEQKISPDFIRKYYDKVEPWCLLQNHNLKHKYTKDEIYAFIEDGKNAIDDYTLGTDSIKTAILEHIISSALSPKEMLHTIDSLKEASKAICSSQKHTSKQR